MTNSELEKIIILHKLKNKIIILRHETSGQYFVFMKKLRNGFNKGETFFIENGIKSRVNTCFLSPERLSRFKYSTNEIKLDYPVGFFDYLT